MTKPAYSLFILSLLFLSACRIQGSFQGLYSYYEKTADIDPALIQRPVLPVCALRQADTAVVYAINGRELKSCIEQFENALVYIWRPKCSSEICISPLQVQRFCEAHRLELFIVAEYYDHPLMTLNHPLKRPVFGVDCPYYDTNLTKKYMALFLNDLLGEAEPAPGSFAFLFNNGCLVDRSDDVAKIKLGLISTPGR